jgi:hypothetical protein
MQGLGAQPQGAPGGGEPAPQPQAPAAPQWPGGHIRLVKPDKYDSLLKEKSTDFTFAALTT